jgi:hypothetical protein
MRNRESAGREKAVIAILQRRQFRLVLHAQFGNVTKPSMLHA